ncbi:MAG: hypothetical protein IT423_10020 [Pirellulaceae bacterium]|nr:hypothetical protein [Pirellulaceae bacterium]
MKAVVIVVEGVGAAMLGPYGSATSTTPALNRLASTSLVLDQCFVDAFDLSPQLRSLWTAMRAPHTQASTWSLWQELADHAIPGQLVTDSPEAAQVAQDCGCSQITLVEVGVADATADAPAEAAEDCSLMQVFAAAMEILAGESQLGVVWIHARGLRHAWDAPLDLRAAMADPEDPLPPDEIVVPHLELDVDSDPDIAVGWGQVAAAQIAVLDQAIDALDQTIQSRADAADWTWMFCSTGGVPLGEHGVIGTSLRLGYTEEIACAAIIRPAHTPPVGTRRAELCQLPDLPVTLLHAMGLSLAEQTQLWGRNMWHSGPPQISTAWPVEHTLAWIEDEQSLWIRTPAWSLVQPDPSRTQLFVKPDDRWEVSDISTRGAEVIEHLLGILPLMRLAAQQGARSQLPSLEDWLTSMCR